MMPRHKVQTEMHRALLDITTGFSLWPLWTRLGWNDILKRYRRSLLGPFWLTVSMGTMIAVLGVLYANLFRTPIRDFLPFLCVGLLIWNLLSSFLIEGSVLFTSAESFIKQIRIPYSVYVYQSAWSKLIIFGHNFIIYFAVLLYFEIWPGIVALLAVPGLMIVVVNGALMGLTVGLVSARFRDVPPIVNSIVQILFFVTPILWKPELLKAHSYLELNPFYHLLEVARAPLLGYLPSTGNYLAAVLITVLNVALTGAVFTKFRSRIAYWV